jgi:putative acetyltransferase
MRNIRVRAFKDADAEATARLFFDSVRLGTRDHYDEAQRRAWAPEIPESSTWRDRLGSQITFVACQEDEIVGFISMKSDGYIDLLFLAPDRTGKGIAKQMYDCLLVVASERSIENLSTEASHLARVFFKRQGWSVTKAQTVRHIGVSMENFRMEIKLQ